MFNFDVRIVAEIDKIKHFVPNTAAKLQLFFQLCKYILLFVNFFVIFGAFLPIEHGSTQIRKMFRRKLR